MNHTNIVTAVLVLGLVIILGCSSINEPPDSTTPPSKYNYWQLQSSRSSIVKESAAPTDVPTPTNAELQEQIDLLQIEIENLKKKVNELSNLSNQ